MKAFRCYGCTNDRGLPGKDFEAAKPICPACGAGNTPRTKGMIVAIEVIHFEAASRVATVGIGHVACDPSTKTPGGERLRFSGETRAVTCAKCKTTPAFAAAAEAQGDDESVPAEANFEVLITPDGPRVDAPKE